jgi:hypothetical protein
LDDFKTCAPRQEAVGEPGVDFGEHRAHLVATISYRAATSPSATRASTSSFAGLTVSKVLPDLAETYLPLIRSCFGFFRKSRTAVEVTPFATGPLRGAAVAIFNFLSALYAFEESNSRASRGGNTTATALTPGS